MTLIDLKNNNTQYSVSFGKRNKATDIITKPIDKVEKIVNNTVDTFTPEEQDEEKKKSHKTAIRVGSTVLVLSAVIALLNPKVSGKLVDKMKELSAKYGSKAKNSDNFTGKFYRYTESFLSKGAKVLNFSNNYNSVKDESFKWVCEKAGPLKKAHNAITKWFDKISKRTVFKKYSKAEKSLDILKSAIMEHESKLSESEKATLANLLGELKQRESYLSKTSVASRLKMQETLMGDLEKEVRSKIKSYGKGLLGENKKKHVSKNMYFWAEEMLKPIKERLNNNSAESINSIIGNENAKNGIYNQIFDIIYPHISQEERGVIDNLFKNAAKKLRNAGNNECTKYFDKKRDLVLGSAPTDVLTALIGLGASGVAIGKADNKDDRISKAITVALPAVAGLGVSMGMTAMLFSGLKGMAIGAASGGILSLMGNTINKIFLKGKQKEKETKHA